MDFKAKLIRNKANGQCTIALPKRKLPKRIIKNLDKISDIKVHVSSWGTEGLWD